jgi:hypothetical protein
MNNKDEIELLEIHVSNASIHHIYTDSTNEKTIQPNCNIIYQIIIVLRSNLLQFNSKLKSTTQKNQIFIMYSSYDCEIIYISVI